MAVFILYKNNGSHGTESGGEDPWRKFWMFYKWNYDLGWLLEDSHMTIVRILSISWGCVMKAIVLQAWMCPVAEVLNLELLHLVNEIQTQLLWLKPISACRTELQRYERQAARRKHGKFAADCQYWYVHWQLHIHNWVHHCKYYYERWL